MKQNEPKKKPIMEVLFGGLTDQEKDDMLELESEFQMWRSGTKKTKSAKQKEKGEGKNAKRPKK